MQKRKYNPLAKVHEFRLKLYVKNFKKMREFYKKVLKYPVREEWKKE